jgi:hypothetical protein
MIDISWGVISGERHIALVVDDGFVRSLCGGTGIPLAPDLPCPACRAEMWALVETTLPVDLPVTA